ncbi:MAG TPA: hypothetical protein PLU38_12925 [Kiritimatiellia bacterium]|nr:hypothetical protein [Kiritimatiellia bacterium]HQQ92756.1 hypothetical protein [Kiritimatiellia bacterium]
MLMMTGFGAARKQHANANTPAQTTPLFRANISPPFIHGLPTVRLSNDHHDLVVNQNLGRHNMDSTDTPKTCIDNFLHRAFDSDLVKAIKS